MDLYHNERQVEKILRTLSPFPQRCRVGVCSKGYCEVEYLRKWYEIKSWNKILERGVMIPSDLLYQIIGGIQFCWL